MCLCIKTGVSSFFVSLVSRIKISYSILVLVCICLCYMIVNDVNVYAELEIDKD